VFLLGDVIEDFTAPGDEAELSSLRGQRKGNRFTDAAAGSGHDGNLIFETLHDFCCGFRRTPAKIRIPRIPLVLRDSVFEESWCV
jgi:hypothetical protein